MYPVFRGGRSIAPKVPGKLRLDRESNPDLCDWSDAILMVEMTCMNGTNYMKWLDPSMLNDDRQSYIFSVNFTNRKNKLVLTIIYRLRKVKRSWKCFINLKCSVCLALGSETKPCFVTLRTFFRSTVGQSGIFNKFDLSKNPKRSERIDADELSKASSTGNEILACDAALSKKKFCNGTRSGHAQFRFRSTTMIENTNLSYIYKQFQQFFSKRFASNARQRSRLWGRCESSHAADQGAFRAPALRNWWVTPPRRSGSWQSVPFVFIFFFFLYVCYIIITWTSFKSIYVTASKRILNANK